MNQMLLTLLATLLCTTTALAGDFSLKTDVGVAVISLADNLSGRGEEHLSSLNDKPKAKNLVFPAIFLDARFRDQSRNLEYYMSNPASEPGQVAAGIKVGFGTSYLDGAIFYSFFGKQWQNPYILDRSATDVREFGGRLKYDKVLGSELALTYKGTSVDVENDLSGRLNDALRRDGSLHRITADYGLRLPAGFTLTPTISYERGAMDGRSNRFHSYEGGLGATFSTKEVLSVARGTIGNRRFDAVHPVFGATRDEMIYGGLLSVTLLNPFPWQGVSMTLSGIYGHTGSNIPFFARDLAIALVTAGYRFR